EALHAVLHLERLFRHGAVPPAPLIDTTLDLDVQQAVATMVADALAELEERGAGNAAAIVVERGTNRVVAWVGSAGYFDARHAGAYDYAGVPRSPGSTLKPFLYALALERGAITPATSPTRTRPSWARSCRASPWPTPAMSRRRTSSTASAWTTATPSSATSGSTTATSPAATGASGSRSAPCRRRSSAWSAPTRCW